MNEFTEHARDDAFEIFRAQSDWGVIAGFRPTKWLGWFVELSDVLDLRPASGSSAESGSAFGLLQNGRLIGETPWGDSVDSEPVNVDGSLEIVLAFDSGVDSKGPRFRALWRRVSQVLQNAADAGACRRRFVFTQKQGPVAVVQSGILPDPWQAQILTLPYK